jgi:hypothetical protein
MMHILLQQHFGKWQLLHFVFSFIFFYKSDSACSLFNFIANERTKIKVDISGLQGNTFALMCIAARIGKRLNRSEEDIEKINDKTISRIWIRRRKKNRLYQTGV